MLGHGLHFGEALWTEGSAHTLWKPKLPRTLTNLAKRGRVAFLGVMRILRWPNHPAAKFTGASDWVDGP
jgi:hypothetical protein